MSWERPMIGFGPGTFRFVQPQLQHEVLATSDHPHNVFLKLAMERGWPAATFFCFFLFNSSFSLNSLLNHIFISIFFLFLSCFHDLLFK
jgi:O-antigen ligase